MIFTDLFGEPLSFETAPGLFSPRALDAGTLAMLSAISFKADDKVLDLGCGYGLVGIVAARAVGGEHVVMSDNDPAAIETARRNLAANHIEGVTLVLSDGFRSLTETGFAKIICHPPYHSDFSVAKHFIEKGFNRLALGGELWMVTRRLDWYRNKLTAIFGGVRVFEDGGYFVFAAEKRSASYANR